MRNWQEISPSKVQNGIEDGKRLILEFARDYKEVIGSELCVGCSNSFEASFKKFLNKKYMKENTTGFKLHEKYNGLKLGGFGSKETISNYSMTKEKALLFLTKHKKGKALFSLLPKDVDKQIEDYLSVEVKVEEVKGKKGKGTKVEEVKEENVTSAQGE